MPKKLFQKGKSGNPGGRPKEAVDIKALAKEHSVEALHKLVYWMRGENAKASISASNAILDRAIGKPEQNNTHEGVEGGKPIKIVLETIYVDAKSKE